jgi:hypothetical protein
MIQLKTCWCGCGGINRRVNKNNHLIYGECSKCGTWRQINDIDNIKVLKQYSDELNVRNSLQFEIGVERSSRTLWMKLDQYAWDLMSSQTYKSLVVHVECFVCSQKNMVLSLLIL